MKKILLNIFFLCLLAGALLFIISNNKKKRCLKREITVGMMSGWEPFMNLNKEGTMYGFDVDLCREIEKELDVNIKIVDLGSLSSCFIALETGKIDCIMSGLDITEKRLKKYNMVCYDKKNKITKAALLNSKNSIINLNSTETPLKIAIEPGSSLEKMLDEYTLVEKIFIPTISEMILNLEFKKVDGFLVEYTLGKKIIKQRDDFSLIELDLPQDFIIYGTGILFKKTDSMLASTFEKIVSLLEKKGIITDLKEKYGI